MLLRVRQSARPRDEVRRHQGAQVHEEHVPSRPHGLVPADGPRLEEDHQEARGHGRIQFLRRLVRLRGPGRALASQAFEAGQPPSELGREKLHPVGKRAGHNKNLGKRRPTLPEAPDVSHRQHVLRNLARQEEEGGPAQRRSLVADRGAGHVGKRAAILSGLNHADLRFVGVEGERAEYAAAKHSGHPAADPRPLLLRRLRSHGELPNSGMSRLEPKRDHALSLLGLHPRHGLPLLVRL